MSKQYQKMKIDFADECQRLAKLACNEYARNTNRNLYVYGVKCGDIWTAFEIAEESGYPLVLTEPLPRNMSVDSLATWIRGRLRREPLWIFQTATN